GEQPGGRAAARLVVLGARSVPRFPRAVSGALRRYARRDLGACRAREESSVVLLLAEHPPDRRSARSLLRRDRLPRAAPGSALVRSRGNDPRGTERAPDLVRRRVLRARDRLRALHARDVP